MQRRQQHCHQDCDNGDHHQQFNQRKAALAIHIEAAGGTGRLGMKFYVIDEHQSGRGPIEPDAEAGDVLQVVDPV